MNKSLKLLILIQYYYLQIIEQNIPSKRLSNIVIENEITGMHTLHVPSLFTA